MVIIFKLNYGGWICCTTNTKQQKQHTGYIYIYISIKSYNILKKEDNHIYMQLKTYYICIYIHSSTPFSLFVLFLYLVILKIEERFAHIYSFLTVSIKTEENLFGMEIVLVMAINRHTAL